jgi:myosin heavy subunit
MEKNEKYFWVKDDNYKILPSRLIEEKEHSFMIEVFYPNSKIKNKIIEIHKKINKDLIEVFTLTGKIKYFEDMANKNFELTENNILNNIRERYHKNNFYNFLGDKVLLKLNNNNKLLNSNCNSNDNYYARDDYKEYDIINNAFDNDNNNESKSKLNLNKDLNKDLNKYLNKDLFKFVENAFNDMKYLKLNQTIILNGESGSGKVYIINLNNK